MYISIHIHRSKNLAANRQKAGGYKQLKWVNKTQKNLQLKL